MKLDIEPNSNFHTSNESTHCILSKNLSPIVPRKNHPLIVIRISKMAQGDEHLNYPDETLECMDGET